MSKSSKRRLAQAAIFNAQSTAARTAKSLLQAASQTAGTQRGTGTPAGVPCSSSPPSLSTSPLCHSATLPLPPSAPSTPHSALSSPPSPFFTEFLGPFCPPQQVDFIELLPIPPDPNHPSAINCQLHDYQAKLKPIFAKLSPDDPNVERINHNYVIVMQIATVERLIASLPGLSEKAMVETNNQIVRMLSIIERTNSRKSRELREKDAAARRIIREQQRKERQTQKQAEALARNQRTQQREELRRQREQAKAERAEQKHQLEMRKLDIKERNLTQLESEKNVEENLHHNSSAKPPEAMGPQSPVALSKPLPPPNSWTCG